MSGAPRSRPSILGMIQNASILFIPSEWQGFLLYVFLFFAIVFFPERPAAAATPQARSHRDRATPAPAATRPPKARREAMEYLYGIIIIVGLYVILATSFNLIIGYGGLVSIAHPVFFAHRRLYVGNPGARFRRAGAARDARRDCCVALSSRSRSRCRRCASQATI